MSLTCPRCGNSLEQDFGVITCGRCHTVLFIDMEGQVQLANAESAASPDSSTTGDDRSSSGASADAGQYGSGGTDSFDSNPEASPEFSSDADPAMPSWQPSQDSTSSGSFDAQENGNGFASKSSGEGLTAESANIAVDGESANDSARDEVTNDAFGGESANGGFSAASVPQSASEGLSEVSDFGNNEQDFGALSYTLLIENIDTGDIRNKLAEALTDSKFQWDVVELLQKIEKGRLEISQLNPVKASILVHRLQEVPVRVSWNQKLL